MARRAIGAAFVALVLAAGAAGAAPPPVAFAVFAHTDLRLGGIAWTGSSLLYLEETTGRIEASDAGGTSFMPFRTIEQGGEEMRCVASSGLYWPPGDLYCHTPDDRILRVAGDGSSAAELARLPSAPGGSDGAIAFDTSGAFGYALLAATGGSASSGGSVYAVHRDGRIDPVGAYPGPGGADEIAVAPRSFGSAARQLLLAVDQGGVSGRLLAVDAHGAVTVVAPGLGNGVNPLAVVAPAPKRRPPGSTAPGLYVTDTNSGIVYFLPAARLRSYVGSAIVGAETPGEFWAVRPHGKGFAVVPLPGALPAGTWNLEGALYVP